MLQQKDAHALFAPSASHRWIHCPASIEMSKDIPDSTSSYAHEGIVCHEVAAKCLKENLSADSFTGQVIDEVQMTKELLDGIQLYVDEVKGLTKEYSMTGGRIEFEVQITKDCWGTIDALLWNPEILIAGDLKMGKGVIVDVENNSQLMIYAVGGLMWLQREQGITPKKVILYIFQPRTVNPIRKWEIDRADLIMWYKDTLKPAIEQIKSGTTECVPGENQCRWCPVSNCAAQTTQLIKTAERAFAPFTEEVKPKIWHSATSGTLNLADISELLPSFEHIKNWIKSLEAYALGKALEGVHVPGHKVVEGRSNRKWKVDETVIAGWLKSKGYEAYDDPPLLSPTKVEKAMGKKEAEAHGLTNYVTKPPGKPTLVIETDKRPVMDTEVDKAFEEFVVSDSVGRTHPDEKVTLVNKSTITLVSPDDVEELAGAEEFAAAPDSKVVKDIADDLMDSMEAGEVILVSDEEEAKEFSALDRLKSASLPDVPGSDDIFDGGVDDMFSLGESSPELSKEQLKESESSGIETDAVSIIVTLSGSGKAKEPLKAPKRLEVLNMGRGGTKLVDVAKALNCGINTVKMHLRYLNERDGYGYKLYSDGTFIVFE